MRYLKLYEEIIFEEDYEEYDERDLYTIDDIIKGKISINIGDRLICYFKKGGTEYYDELATVAYKSSDNMYKYLLGLLFDNHIEGHDDYSDEYGKSWNFRNGVSYDLKFKKL